jgi:hypothetical protein
MAVYDLGARLTVDRRFSIWSRWSWSLASPFQSASGFLMRMVDPTIVSFPPLRVTVLHVPIATVPHGRSAAVDEPNLASSFSSPTDFMLALGNVQTIKGRLFSSNTSAPHSTHIPSVSLNHHAAYELKIRSDMRWSSPQRQS